MSALYPKVAWPQTVTSCITEIQSLNEEENDDAKSAREIIAKVATSIGLSRAITVIACPGAEKLFSLTSAGKGNINAGDYVVFDPDWLREVAGKKQTELAALLGHEIGHLINGDFVPPRELLKQAILEGDADYFAGCAVARQGGHWTELSMLIQKIRRRKSRRYPDRLVSESRTREGFDGCGGDSNKASSNGKDCPSTGFCGIINAPNSLNVFGGTVTGNTINIGPAPR